MINTELEYFLISWTSRLLNNTLTFQNKSCSLVPKVLSWDHHLEMGQGMVHKLRILSIIGMQH